VGQTIGLRGKAKQSTLRPNHALLDDPHLAAHVTPAAEQLALGARELQRDDLEVARHPRVLRADSVKAREPLAQRQAGRGFVHWSTAGMIALGVVAHVSR
jgi:hypothetical protein